MEPANNLKKKRLRSVLWLIYFLSVGTIGVLCEAKAQNIGINSTGASPDNSAMLDVSSTSKGLLIPRMTTAQRNGITTPALSLFVFNTDDNCFQAYNSILSQWENIHCFITCPPVSSPTAGTHTATYNNIVWNWNTVAGATGYKYSTTNDYATATDNGAGTSFTQSGLLCNTAYTLYVWAYSACGNSTAATLTSTTLGDCVSGWAYKKTITLNNTTNSNALTNYQVRVTIDHATLVTAGKSTATGSDLRFTDGNCTVLDYWIERGANTSACDIWVKVPAISANANTTITMFYGNPGASAYSNGDNTFILFDDFNGSSLDLTKWARSADANATNTGVSGGYVHILQDQTDKNISIYSVSGTLPYQIRAVSYKRVFRNGSNYFGLQQFYPAAGGSTVAGVQYNYESYCCNGCTSTNFNSFDPLPCVGGQKIPTFWQSTWFREEMHLDGSVATGNYYLSRYDGTTFENITTYDAPTYTINDLKLQLNSYGWFTGHYMDVNYIAIGKYISNEPTVSFGIEDVTCP